MAKNTVKVRIELELDQHELAQLMQNSIERVMNNAVYVGSIGQADFSLERDHERASTLWQDCEELKPLVCKIWSALQNKVFEEKLR